MKPPKKQGLIQFAPQFELSDPKKRNGFLLQAFFSNRSPSTLKNYKAAMLDFAQFLGVETNEEAVAHLFSRPHGEANATVLAYRQALLSRKLAPNTINVRLSAVKSMGKLARVLGLVPWVIEVDNIKVESYRDTAGPGKEAVVKVIVELERRTDPPGLRDLAIVRLLYTQGLRRKEVAGLDLKDYDAKNSVLWILGKDRTQPEKITLAPKTKLAIEAWLAARPPGRDSLFLNFDPAKKGDGRFSGKGVYRVCQKYGLGHPHGLRHSAVTEALELTNGDMRKVQRFSRHKKIETLLKYDDNRRDLGGDVAKRLDEGT